MLNVICVLVPDRIFAKLAALEGSNHGDALIELALIGKARPKKKYQLISPWALAEGVETPHVPT